MSVLLSEHHGLISMHPVGYCFHTTLNYSPATGRAAADVIVCVVPIVVSVFTSSSVKVKQWGGVSSCASHIILFLTNCCEQQIQPVSSPLCFSFVVLSTVMNFWLFPRLIRCVETEAFVAVRGNASMLEAILNLK